MFDFLRKRKKADVPLPANFLADHSEPPETLNTAVLFLVFNRPDMTNCVFEAIRKARPHRLYVGSDGPREEREGEAEKVAKVRDIFANVDWPCQVMTLFHEKNLGCRFGPQAAIDWFFKHEEEGIILEDDCLPHHDFFKICDWALNAYRENKNIWHINGNNFDAPSRLFSSNLSFTSIAQVWGWATWKDRWQHYTGNPFYLMDDSMLHVDKWMLSPLGRINKLKHIEELQRGLDAWDFQWQAVILNNQGLCISCRSNLISNFGDGPDATHTKRDHRIRLATKGIMWPLVYTLPKNNQGLTSLYEQKMGLRSINGAVTYGISKTVEAIQKIIKGVFARILFFGVKPIVVASTGRNGSTLLFNSVANSLIATRFKINSESVIGRLLVAFTAAYIERIAEVRTTPFPVLKTHDQFSPSFKKDSKFIFIYGDPLEAARSAELAAKKNGRIWLDEHLYHLCSDGNLDDIYKKDILNFQKQIISWLTGSHESILALNFDDLWSKLDEISKFVGFKVTLPEKRNRVQKPALNYFNENLFSELRKLIN